MNISRISAIFSSLGIVGLFLVCQATAAIVDVSDYANLGMGYGWNYQQSLYPEPWRVEVESMATKNGVEVFLLQEYDSRGFRNDQHFIGSDLSSGMYMVGGLNDYGQATEEELFWSPPVPILLHDFTPGQPYPFSTEHSSSPGLTINGNLLITHETVSVPAGTFVDTLKAVQSYDGIVLQTWWYADGAGLVKRAQEDGNVWELTSVSGFELPVPVPVPAAFWLSLSGIGALLLRLKKHTA